MKPQAQTLLHRLARTLSLCAGLLLAGPTLALDIDLGNAAPYSVFVFEDVSSLPGTPGRLAVGGNLTLGNASLGAGLPTLAGMPTLLVRGNILGFNGPLLAGSAAGFGQYIGTKAASVPPALDLRKVSILPLDFDAEKIYLTAMSEQLRDLPPSGQVLATGGTLTLKGSNQALEVFTLTAAQAGAAQRVALDSIAPDAHIVVNLSADSLRRISFGIDTTALAGWRGRVLFNAHDAETLQFNGLTFWGSVLATNACVCTSTGTLMGSVVARKWTALMNVDYTPFVPKP
jgi:choice-of-anchor A domain-containing protein